MFLVIIFVGEIAIGVLVRQISLPECVLQTGFIVPFCIQVYLKEAPYQEVIRKSVDATVTKKYHHNSTATTKTFDLIQEGVNTLSLPLNFLKNQQ